MATTVLTATAGTIDHLFESKRKPTTPLSCTGAPAGRPLEALQRLAVAPIARLAEPAEGLKGLVSYPRWSRQKPRSRPATMKGGVRSRPQATEGHSAVCLQQDQPFPD